MRLPDSAPLPPLVLGSTSPYRRDLLQRLGLPFTVAAPQVDETSRPGEAPGDLAHRLALEKAWDVAERHPGSVVIGADQVADLGGQALGKPGGHPQAVAQLQAMSGKAVVFHTAVAVLHPAAKLTLVQLAPVRVRFRHLNGGEIEHYLQLEQPYDCAGSAKCEGLGISLLDAIDSDDPTALIGLPLIRTCQMLRLAGFSIPGASR